MFSLSQLPSTTSVLSTYTAFSASAMLVRSVLNEIQNLANQLIPHQLREKIVAKFGGLMGFNSSSSSQMILVLDETNGFSNNQVFEASELYLQTRISASVARLKVFKSPGEKNLSVSINQGEKIIDRFEDIQVVWQLTCTESQKKSTSYDGNSYCEKVERISFELSFHKKHREKIMSSYLPYVLEKAEAINEQKRVVKLHTLGSYNGDVNLNHPSTFETLAMDPTLKKELIDDLDRFLRRRQFYKRVGKAWKRGYLLYGPPGTGKSSLIAAIANYLKFHVYDLELASVHSNLDFRRLLLSTANRSILVIEDIDCSNDFQNRQPRPYTLPGLQPGRRHLPGVGDNQVTLSGLLNFIDGLWSSCGDERIIIFTTNHKDRLDPALLRPGRMDMHIHMSYCTPCGFKILASNYLCIANHSLFPEIEKLVTEVEVTPAEIAEELMRSEEADVALNGLIKYLHMKKLQHGNEGNDEGEKEVVSEQEQENRDVKMEAKNKGRKIKVGKISRGRQEVEDE